MTIQDIGDDIQRTYASLAQAVATVRHLHEHYLDSFEAAYGERLRNIDEARRGSV